MSELDRFIKAQETDYDRALREIKNGRKQTCWMWYIFPQIIGLGSTPTAKEYAIKNMEEAIEYLRNDILKNRLVEISQALLELEGDNARQIMGYPDDLKLRSSMTLFKKAEESSEIKCDNIFQKVLDKFYNGEDDNLTLKILYEQNLEKEKEKENKENKSESENKSENEEESNKENINNNERNENSRDEEDDKDKIAHLDSIPTISSQEFLTQGTIKDNIQNDNQNDNQNNIQNNTPNDIQNKNQNNNQNNIDLPENEIKKYDNNKKKEEELEEEQKGCMDKLCNFTCIII